MTLSRRELLSAGGSSSVGLLAAGSSQRGEGNRSTDSAGFAPLADLLRQDGLDARNFGATFDGKSDDGPALQRAIDAAHQARRSLRLPSGTAILGSPLSLKGRDVAIVGAGMTATVLRAGRALPTLMDVQEESDRIVSPFSLMRLTLDGAGATERNLAVRFRHHSFLFEINSVAGSVGFWERDCWLARRYNCRSADNRIGWHLVGANHSSIWEGCTISGCSEVHLRINNQGTAPDGNAALLFRSCDIEFGAGHGVETSPGTNAVFESCYLGENIGGDVVRNMGFLVVRGGAFFFGGGTGIGIRPLGGRAYLEKVAVNGQSGGVANLVNLAPDEAGAEGQITIADANGNLPVGGLHVLNGDPLGRIPMTTFAPRLGRDWEGWAHAATIREETSGDLPDGRLVLAGSGGRGARIGLRAPLATSRWRESLPVYLACVYRASAPIDLALVTPRSAARHPIVTLPSSQGHRITVLTLATRLPVRTFAAIEASMPATSGALLALQELTLADGNVLRTPGGTLRTLALAE